MNANKMLSNEFPFKVKCKLRVNLSLIIYIFFIPLIFIISLIVSDFDNTLQPMIMGFTVIYLVTLVYAIKEFGVLSLYSIFLYTNIFFVYSEVFLQAIFPYAGFNFLEFPLFLNTKFSADEGMIFLVAAFLETYIMNVIYCFRKKNVTSAWNTEQRQCPIYIKAGILMMIIFFIPALTKIIIELRYIIKYGYVAIFLGYKVKINYPIWVSGASALFVAGYYVFLAGNPNKKQFIRISLFYGIISLLTALKGQRAGFITFLLISVYWYTKKYSIKIKTRTVTGFGVVLMFLIVGLNLLRNSYGTNGFVENATLKLVFDKIVGQSASSIVPLFIIRGGLEYHKYPFIFSPLLYPINFLLYRGMQSDIAVQHTNDISDVITYNVSQPLYLRGNGVGGAFLGEAYDCGGFIGVVFWSVLLAIVIHFFDNRSVDVKSRYIPILYAFLSSIPLMPRSRFFGFSGSFFTLCITYFVMLFANLMKTKCK